VQKHLGNDSCCGGVQAAAEVRPGLLLVFDLMRDLVRAPQGEG
jgi:hypothetical protein